MKFSRKNRVSVFDLDHTLIRCTISVAFGRYLFKRGVFSFPTYLLLAVVYAFHKLNLVSLCTVHNLSFRLLFCKQLKAHTELMVKEFLNKTPKLFKTEIVSLMKASKCAGDSIIIQSSSPDFLVQPIAQELDVDFFFASVYKTDNEGRFSAVEVLDGKGKEVVLRKYLQEHEVSSHTTAYTDSFLDLPLLEKVAAAVAVNPDRRLFCRALKKDWAILL